MVPEPRANAATTGGIDQVLADVFGFASLRPGQAAVIDDLLACRPVVAVMPTGAGKSLCYQLPAVLLGDQGGFGLVVSPLIALMKDQVDSLLARDVAAASLTSAQTPAQQREILDGIRGGDFRLIYVAPERFRSARFVDALAEVADKLELLAVDEAHCISEWGHEFRPDYRRLGSVIARMQPRRLIALTATATPEVREDIAQQLQLESPCFHVRGFDRPNLQLAVESAGGFADKSARVIEKVRMRAGGVALVYVATRKNAERYAEALAGAGMRAGVYHAGLDDDARRLAQEQFMNGQLDVIVATNAFGMGVDKADIRVVIHADLPRSPEAYYQEAGRGGRDGVHGDCVLLFNHGDVRLQEFLIDASYPSADVLRSLWKLVRERPGAAADVDRLRTQLPGEPHASTIKTAFRVLSRHGYLVEAGDDVRAVRPDELGGEYPPMDVESLQRRAEVERGKLRKMVEYAYHPRCRRQFVLDYFGDIDWADRNTRCSACDNCKGHGRAQSLSDEQKDHVRSLLSVVSALRGRFGRARIASIANGSDDDDRFIDMPERGILRGQTARYLMDLIRSLEGAGLVDTSRGDYPTISVTRAGRRVIDGDPVDGVALLMPDRTTRRRAGKKAAKKQRAVTWQSADSDPIDVELAERLRALRGVLARERSVPAYVVFSNRTLEAIARQRPQTLDELLAVDGIGPSRLEAYGDAILEVV